MEQLPQDKSAFTDIWVDELIGDGSLGMLGTAQSVVKFQIGPEALPQLLLATTCQ